MAEDKHHPFKVITGNITTTVLGTSFYVSSDSARREIQIALVHGKVSVTDKEGNSLILQPSEMVKYVPDNIEKTAFDYDQMIGWINNKLVFHQATLQEVVDKLENWYGVEFVANEPIFEGYYSGAFENETLKNVLDGINFTSNFQYKIDHKKVIINRPKP